MYKAFDGFLRGLDSFCQRLSRAIWRVRFGSAMSAMRAKSMNPEVSGTEGF
jgi:hypothetical protein